MQVLVVDDDDFALEVIENTMARMGYSVVSAHDGREAMNVLCEGKIRLVITDWDMPEMNGVELCRAIRRDEPSGYVYIIMLTGREGAKQRMEGLCAGADAFLNKPLDPDELLVCLKTAERILSLETRDVALFALAKLAESRDSETGAHVERVQSYTRLIARNLSPQVKSHYGVDEEFVRLLYQTSPLHDLGKVGIPDSILLKPGRLTSEEFAIMQTHTVVGAQTLDAALQRFPNTRFLQIAREIAATHHEKFDGSGYPHGLAGEGIPLCGRIVAVADVYDALTSRRVYKDAMTHEEAKAILIRDRGSHFDSDVIDAFLRAEEQVLGIKERMGDHPQPGASQPQFLPSALAGAGSTAPCKILVAEDDPEVLQKLGELLAATGEPVFCARDGEEAIDLWERHGPRVVVSDWVMPHTDGVELCAHVRARAGTAPAHFIMLTSHSDKTRMLEAYQAGVDDFVSKPFDPEELLARVRAGIRTTKLHDELVRKAAGSQVLNAQLATINSRLEKLSITDELTGLFNRRHAMYRLEEQWTLAERYGRPLSVAMVDIDHFKRINDTYGHGAGDAILKQVAAILRDHTRGTDAVCRVGGEEFLILFPQQTTREARSCAERCRGAVERFKFNLGGLEMRVTVSIGIAARVPGLVQFPDLLRVADEAMYAAKHSGRNAVRVADEGGAVLGGSVGNGDRALLSGPERPPVDLEIVLKRCGGDAKFAAAITQRFRAQAGNEIDRAQSALNAGDAGALSRAAHTLKSMAAYVSADPAAELARRIENLAREGQLREVPSLLTELREQITAINHWIAQNSAASAARSA